MSGQGSALDQFLYLYEVGLKRHIDQVNSLLPELVKEIHPNSFIKGSCLLHILAPYPQVRYELLLLEDEIDCNAVNRYKETPLHIACHYDNEKVVKLLLKHGAKIDNAELQSPLVELEEISVTDTTIRILKLLIEYGANVNSTFPVTGWISGKSFLSLCIAACARCLSTNIEEHDKRILFLRELVNGGADINYIDSDGRNSLHWACHYNDMSIAKLLIENGCDYNLKDQGGQLPIDKIASDSMRKEFLEIIQEKDCR